MSKLKILVEMKHGLGDCICDLPMIKILRDNYPDAYIVLLVNNKVNEDLIKLSGIKINKFYYFSLKNNSLISTIKLIAKLRLLKFDYGILATMTPKVKGKVFFWLLGIKNCIGEQFLGINFFDLDNKIHFVNRNINLLKSWCQIPKTKIEPHIFVDEKYFNKIKTEIEVKRYIIGVCIGNGDTSPYKGRLVYTRGWGIEKIKKLLIKLMTIENLTILLFGGTQEVKLLNSLEDIIKSSSIINYVGKTDIVQSATLVKLCKLVVGVDTGMQHIADAVGVRTLSIFGPTNYRTHGAYSKRAQFIECFPKLECQYCFTNKDYYECEKRKCMDMISVDDVYNKIINIMEEMK